MYQLHFPLYLLYDDDVLINFYYVQLYSFVNLFVFYSLLIEMANNGNSTGYGPSTDRQRKLVFDGNDETMGDQIPGVPSDDEST